MTKREPNLLAWQWNGYPDFHADRRNLVLHVLTQPIFVAGFVTVLGAPLAGSLVAAVSSAVGGLVAMVVAIAVQGRGHAQEKNAPIPFAGAGDLIGRILLEQLVSFPRFVLTGGLARAWRASVAPQTAA
ncbi:MAG: hypothetical protein U0234_17720 [Sandaracinus sp.]